MNASLLFSNRVFKVCFLLSKVIVQYRLGWSMGVNFSDVKVVYIFKINFNNFQSLQNQRMTKFCSGIRILKYCFYEKICVIRIITEHRSLALMKIYEMILTDFFYFSSFARFSPAINTMYWLRIFIKKCKNINTTICFLWGIKSY